MTERVAEGIFSADRKLAACAALLVALAFLGGCTSTNLEDTVPAAQPSGLSSGQAQDTGSFPNLNIPPQVAAPQITPEEKAAKLSELEAAQAAQAAVPAENGTAEDQIRLKKLAETHASSTLAEIEKK
jgi:hypothetical protein